jgi:ribosomal protein L11
MLQGPPVANRIGPRGINPQEIISATRSTINS